MKVILISGKAGSGKSSLAHMIQSRLDRCVVTNFSKYIKLFALEMTNWDGSEENKPRTFLQDMGDTLRSIDIDFMTRRLEEDMEVYKKYYDYVIICDVRLIHELEYFNDKYPTYSIRITDNDNRKGLDDNQSHHITEVELDNYEKFDLIVDDNNINNNIDKIVKGLKLNEFKRFIY